MDGSSNLSLAGFLVHEITVVNYNRFYGTKEGNFRKAWKRDSKLHRKYKIR